MIRNEALPTVPMIVSLGREFGVPLTRSDLHESPSLLAPSICGKDSDVTEDGTLKKVHVVLSLFLGADLDTDQLIEIFRKFQENEREKGALHLCVKNFSEVNKLRFACRRVQNA